MFICKSVICAPLHVFAVPSFLATLFNVWSSFVILLIVSLMFVILVTVPLSLTKLVKLLPSTVWISSACLPTLAAIESRSEGLLSMSRTTIQVKASRNSVKELTLTVDLEIISLTRSIDMFFRAVADTAPAGSSHFCNKSIRVSAALAVGPQTAAIFFSVSLPALFKPTLSRKLCDLSKPTTPSNASPPPSSADSITI